MSSSIESTDTAIGNSVTKVFGITELLEQVLVKVDFKTLLLSQRVNHMFEQVIKGSKMLQKKLCFLPVDSFEEALALGFAEEGGVLLRLDSFDDLVSSGHVCVQPSFLNSHLFHIVDRWQPERLWNFPKNGFKLRAAPIAGANKSISTVQKSAERTLLAQPPTNNHFHKLEIRSSAYWQPGPFDVDLTMDLGMGDVAKRIGYVNYQTAIQAPNSQDPFRGYLKAARDFMRFKGESEGIDSSLPWFPIA
ncbi:uncharacterized protein LTR77_005866 [Saxophila tyrrhenica]|uniref:Uncharacterized protein n=1 Tax=Saxophila tyrrhenica TaxID=1690608 RepID=A0AAV9PA47_9PEZI|nr:hypothetical protein LTR77_005866 [Saxophila tyrrhenica]